MTSLRTDFVLVRVPELDFHVGSQNYVTIEINQQTISGGLHSLAILDTFRQPTVVKEAVKRLSSGVLGARDWIDLMNEIDQMYQAGVLVDPALAQPTVSEQPSFDRAYVHIAMLNDRYRTESYLDAIRSVVCPGDVVVDLGTGTGVLAIAAAQAGARRVYAIEVGRIGEAARANFEANQLADRITLVRGWSTQVSLPEPADVLVSEIIGNDPLQERVLEYMSDAVQRFVRPGGRLIPAHIRIFAQFVSLPDEMLGRYFFTRQTLAQWKDWYGLSFDALTRITTGHPFCFYVKPDTPKFWPSLTDPILLSAFDLRDVGNRAEERTVEVTIQRAGRLDAVLIYPEIDLSPQHLLTRSPAQIDEGSHWRTPIWALPDALELRRGDQVALTYRPESLNVTRI